MKEKTKTKHATPCFSIVIPAYNEEKYIGLCLQSIFNSDYDDTRYEVIVVDNGSQDRTYEVALSFERANVFRLMRGNVGAVRNYGVKQSRGRILVFIDADCLIDRDWLRRAEKLFINGANCAYGGGVKLPSSATWIEKSWLLQDKDRPTLPKHLIGASTMLSKEHFLNIGGFNELVSSGEDSDLHSRLNFGSVPVLIDHALNVTHLGNAKTAMQFIRRQIWHSENYITNFKQSIKDPIFFVILIFIFLPFSAVAQMILSSNHTNITWIAWFLVPTLLSSKRLLRANYITISPEKLLRIYFLDILYLTGRSLGLLKGILNLMK